MKLLLLTLAWAMCTASPIVLSDESVSKAAKLMVEIQEFAGNVRTAVEEKLALVSRSELGRAGEDLYDIYYKASQLMNSLMEELPTEVSQTYDIMADIPGGVAEKAINVLHEVREKLMPKEEEFLQVLQAKAALDLERVNLDIVGQLHGQVARIVELDPKLNEKLEKLLQELSPYVNETRHQLQEEEKFFEPIAGQLREHLKAGLQKGSQIMQSLFAPILKAFREHRSEFRQWVNAPVFPSKEQ
ncbi:uncharacterized protein LOC128332587 [Hemicordylus capensis]|uniref:uncharacterized protein LOC128332587 n=1 Tax=Hemicordylus capensis TaxID=884348 RepID=UPI002303B319|nr:uncharacterized protein LOC128332587 [Hemicordylus capensis]